jgi:hypothetical protein
VIFADESWLRFRDQLEPVFVDVSSVLKIAKQRLGFSFLRNLRPPGAALAGCRFKPCVGPSEINEERCPVARNLADVLGCAELDDRLMGSIKLNLSSF